VVEARDLVIEAIPPGDSIVLDTSTVISYLHGGEPASPAARRVLDGLVATERNPAVISSVTVSEVLVGPLRRLGVVPDGFKAFLLDFPGLATRSADFLVAAEAANIRARTGMALPDAFIAATATLTSSPWLITNDRTLRDQLAKLEWSTTVVLLSEVGG
jgi:predicted nucleic acid-binding protein